MILKLLLLQLTAHLLADFNFQPPSWSARKKLGIVTPTHIYHAFVVGIFSYLLSFSPGFWYASLLIMILHFLTDVLKSKLQLRYPGVDFFFADQAVHLLSLTGLVFLYSGISDSRMLIDPEPRVLAIILAYLFCTKPTNLLIKHLLKAFRIEYIIESSPSEEEKSLPNVGKLIGISERFLALTLILIGQYEAVGLIIAAKSILRFNDMKKSEYVLVGTLLSFAAALFAGIMVSMI